MFAGVYTNDITPKDSVDLNGYILRFGKSQGIHDRLTANFLYVESNLKKILLISLDLLTISMETADKLRNEISIQLQMEKEAIIIAAIHTHSAIGRPYLRNVGRESEEWQKDFEEKIIEGSKLAQNKKIVCDLYSYEAYSAVGINRRNPSRGIDPNAPFMVIKHEQKILAWIINYNCHAVSLREDNLYISADYVHYLREYLYNKLNCCFPILFFNGGSGDIDPKQRGSFGEAQFTGEKLADELLITYRVYEGKQLSTDIECFRSNMIIPYAWQPSVEEAKDNLAEYRRKYDCSVTREEKKINGAFLEWANEVLKKAQQNTLPISIDITISSIRIGEALFIAVPLEIFSSLSIKLRKIFGNYSLFIIGYGNGYAGYLADKAAHFQGGYEIEDWHKYAGILPKVSYVEDIFWECIEEFLKKYK
jgi:neutral ceramidase